MVKYLNMNFLQMYSCVFSERIWKSVNIWESYGQEFCALLFLITVYMFCIVNLFLEVATPLVMKEAKVNFMWLLLS